MLSFLFSCSMFPQALFSLLFSSSPGNMVAHEVNIIYITYMYSKCPIFDMRLSANTLPILNSFALIFRI